MLGNDRSKPGDADHYTDSSPNYPFFSTDTVTSLSVATGLMIATILGIVLTADTVLAETVLWLFEFAFIIGVVVLGAGLTIGRYLGVKGMMGENYPLAAVGAFISVFTYSIFGGAVVTPYNPELYIPAIGITGVITIVITIISALYVYSTDRDLVFVADYSAKAFLIGIIAALIGTFIEIVIIVAFVFILLGFLLDLVYEIWMISDGNRTPIANGFGLYIAFAGVFVHILQIVIQILASRN